MKKFDVPDFYRSPIISRIKELRKEADPRKKDYSSTILDFGPVRFFIARHFGFCYGVENAIEIAYRAIEENPDKRIFLLSEMIHNPEVNKDLINRGVRFLMDTLGDHIVEWSELNSDDIVVIPAFGTTLEIEEKLKSLSIDPYRYNTTCPFVERVWKMSKRLGDDNYTILIHGKYNHEETRATFSHAAKFGPALILRDHEEAETLGKIISGEIPKNEFYQIFKGKYSLDFDVEKHLKRIGVVNQTTMLATETKDIAAYLKTVMENVFEVKDFKEVFADTRDSLCYATNDNQSATYALMDLPADIAIVVGGYNSSNTTHLVELCETKFPTYFISSEKEIESENLIHHFLFHSKEHVVTKDFLPKKEVLNIILTSGASCPDSTVDKVLQQLLGYFENTLSVEEVMKKFELNLAEHKTD
ncbi:MAG: 4-hydroxy-3-methylbut-2-enyl diphosphate reductase [Bacteroidetes bacterium]|nr:4-hydroxy-3-methylbut-2-enyl diphosphate reductase [Bacteroidota bacterium]